MYLHDEIPIDSTEDISCICSTWVELDAPKIS